MASPAYLREEGGNTFNSFYAARLFLSSRVRIKGAGEVVDEEEGVIDKSWKGAGDCLN
jgi:hypothetical protein